MSDSLKDVDPKQQGHAVDTGAGVDAAEPALDAHDDAGTTGIQTLLQELHLKDENALREEFMHLQEERDSLEEQYQTLLSKVSQMRTTLGERLQQDAVGVLC